MANIDNSAWDGPAAMAACLDSDDPAAAFEAICAGRKEGDPKLEQSWALPHHKTPGAPPNASGVRNALSRLPQTEGLTNKQEAQSHLERHMKIIQAAESKNGMTLDQIRHARALNAHDLPGGPARLHPFPGQIRAQIVQRDGRDFYEVDGYATIFNQPYRMYDMFGEYMETVDRHALDKSLAANPDVAFLVNHRGVTMARTNNGTLDLSTDMTGLRVHAYLNADRQDVRDLASAIRDGLVDQMSFAFMLNLGNWDEDFENFRIMEANIDRGDVSAVNFGANPYTSINARASEWLAMASYVPTTVARAAFSTLQARLDALPVVDFSALNGAVSGNLPREKINKTSAETSADLEKGDDFARLRVQLINA